MTHAQIFFGILILGLSGHLVATQLYGGAPSSTNYNVFLGLYVLVAALVGLASGFVSALRGLVTLVTDSLAVLFTFAGGVAYAVQLGTGGCGCDAKFQACERLTRNTVINGGIRDGKVGQDVNRVGRCREAQADTAFIFLAFVCFAASAALSFLAWRRGGVK